MSPRISAACGRSAAAARAHLFLLQPFEVVAALGLRVGDGQQFVSGRGGLPAQQLEVVARRALLDGAVEAGESLLGGGDVARRGHHRHEVGPLCEVEFVGSVRIGAGKGMAVGKQDVTDRLFFAGDAALHRACNGSEPKNACQKAKKYSFHGQGAFFNGVVAMRNNFYFISKQM